MRTARYNNSMAWIAAAALLAYALLMPISVAASNILLIIASLFALEYCVQTSDWQPIIRNPWFWFSASFLAFFLIAMCYGEASLHYRLQGLTKHLYLLQFALLLPILARFPWLKQRAIDLFLAAMLITAILSTLNTIKVFDIFTFIPGVLPDRFGADAIFMDHIKQNFMMVFAAYFAFQSINNKQHLSSKIAWGTICAFMIYNVLFISTGRTGYVVLLILAAYEIWKYLRYRPWWAIITAVLGIILVLTIAYLTSHSFKFRVDETVINIVTYNHNHYHTSMGLRIKSYIQSFDYWQLNPWFGLGTGGYHQLNNYINTNTYGNWLVEFGLIGTAFLLFLIVRLWQFTKNLSGPYARYTRPLLLAMLAAGLANPIFTDTNEAHLFGLLMALAFSDYPITTMNWRRFLLGKSQLDSN